MGKTPPIEMVDSVATNMLNYLKNGEINPGFIEKKLEFNGIDRIQDLESILKIHFVLSKEVVDYLEKLPRRVRRIKTESKKQIVSRRGEVQGKVNWNKTISSQTQQNNRSIFICQNPSKNYNVPENLVLKKLLSIIYQALEHDLKKPLEKNYDWLKHLKDEEDLIAYLKNIYKKNVHINRIKQPEEIQINERHLSIAENSRKELYKEASQLLIKHQKLMQGEYNKKDLNELLNETLILPGETHRLFELYTIFKILKKLEKNLELQKIEEGTTKIASYKENNQEIHVYHDSTGQITFHEKIEKLKQKTDIEYLERYRKATLEHAELTKNLLNKEKPTPYQGRPDILIEHYQNKKLTKLTIGEVKYTENKQTFQKGLKELIKYLYYAKQKQNYLTNLNQTKTHIEGLIITDQKNYIDPDKLNENNKIIENPTPFKIKILDTNDLKNIK